MRIAWSLLFFTSVWAWGLVSHHYSCRCKIYWIGPSRFFLGQEWRWRFQLQFWGFVIRQKFLVRIRRFQLLGSRHTRRNYLSTSHLNWNKIIISFWGFVTRQVVIRDRSLPVFGPLYTALIFSNNDESNYWQFKLYLSYYLGPICFRGLRKFSSKIIYIFY